MKKIILLLCVFGSSIVVSFAQDSERPRVIIEESQTSVWERFLSSVFGVERRGGELLVLVKDANGQAVVGADVLVGPREGVPFAGNKSVTNLSGIVQFSSPELKGPGLSLTVKKSGYGTVSIMKVEGDRVAVRLVADPDPSAFAFLQGRILGFPPGFPSSIAELGFFVPAIKPSSLLNFDMYNIISPYFVEMDVYGKRQVPGNIVFPFQRKSYILPITLNKPEFIMPMAKTSSTRMTAMLGSIPLADAISAMQKGELLEMLNYTSFTHVNWTERMAVNGDTRLDITAREPLAKQKISSVYSGVPSNLDVVAVAMLAPGGDTEDMVPIDVKCLKREVIKNGQGVQKMASLSQLRAQDQLYVFSGVLDRTKYTDLTAISERAISASITPVGVDNTANTEGFLNVMKMSSISTDKRTYQFNSPNSAAYRADLIQLNLYSDVDNPATKSRLRRLVWTAILPGDATSVSLPLIDLQPVFAPPSQSKNESFAWELVAVRTTPSKRSKPTRRLDTGVMIQSLRQVSSSLELFK